MKGWGAWRPQQGAGTTSSAPPTTPGRGVWRIADRAEKAKHLDKFWKETKRRAATRLRPPWRRPISRTVRVVTTNGESSPPCTHTDAHMARTRILRLHILLKVVFVLRVCVSLCGCAHRLIGERHSVTTARPRRTTAPPTLARPARPPATRSCRDLPPAAAHAARAPTA
ncbi:hypothetical protein E2C01_032630 [Portunus trituberculatus]|uniref:Uncharacterized protein n=1 Tax=Portunus trituberculatus TaxID=210409 RepID=A0A5B7F1J8_PORTR|nr:hypothetical protein [Portunus trituberculatus]